MKVLAGRWLLLVTVCLGAHNVAGKTLDEAAATALVQIFRALPALWRRLTDLADNRTKTKAASPPPRPVVLGAGCTLPVKQMPKYQPVLIVNNKLAVPASHGHVVFHGEDDVTVACPGKNNDLVTFRGKDDVTAGCGGKETLVIGGAGYALQDLGCVRSVSGEIVTRGGKCGGTGRQHHAVYMELGFRVQSAWYEMIGVCHDPLASATLYVIHTLHGAALPSAERHKNRPSFHEGGAYETFNPDADYRQAAQMATLAGILGSRKLAERYLADTFLSRGHLAPNADFILDAYQDLSFFYVNTAPQWQSVNAGNWGSLEKTVRRHALKQGLDLQVVTGTYGVLKLRDTNGVLREIYLHGNGTEKRLPVPAHFWKIVYDPLAQAAIAFVSINNGFLDRVTAADMLCKDVCNKYGWGAGGGNWQNLATGFVYCCDVTDLKQTVSYVPRLRIKKTMSYGG